MREKNAFTSSAILQYEGIYQHFTLHEKTALT